MEKSPIEDLVKALKKDKGYFISWRANIAMAFEDEFYRSHQNYGVRKISKNAANNFLKQLIKK